jgi:hypothetical protein
MFGLFRSKREKWLIKVEQAMMVMERAAIANDLRTLHTAIVMQTRALHELNVLDVGEQEFFGFINRRGKVRWIENEKFRELMEGKAMEAQARYGLI